MRSNRFGLLVLFFILIFALLEVRLVQLMLFPDPRLKSSELRPEKRGLIFDRKGRELAVNETFYSIYARPDKMSDTLRSEIYSRLASIGLPELEIRALDSKKGFTWVRRHLPSRIAESLKDWIDKERKNNPAFKDSLGLVAETGRYYTYPAAFALTGMTGLDNRGLCGLEYTYNAWLEAGSNVETSLDAELNETAMDELSRVVSETGADAASLIVVDLRTMELLVLAGYPFHDPNRLDGLDQNSLKAVPVSWIFEPGSVMKQFSAAYALRERVASSHYPVYYCGGAVRVGDHIVTCDAAHGSVDLAMILQKSCNVGMAQVSMSFKNQPFSAFLRGLGFGSMPDVPLTGRESGILRPADQWSGLSKTMISIGQEIGVTSLQLAVASSVIGSGGIYRPALVVRNPLSLSNDVQTALLSPEDTRTLLTMMERVVGENGTALSAKIEGIQISGKTGTGQIAREGGGGYYSDRFNAVFVGYLPSNAPKYCVVVAVHNPKGKAHTGGGVAAPVFSSFVRRMIATTEYLHE